MMILVAGAADAARLYDAARPLHHWVGRCDRHRI
jgi:hypothetical protein